MTKPLEKKFNRLEDVDFDEKTNFHIGDYFGSFASPEECAIADMNVKAYQGLDFQFVFKLNGQFSIEPLAGVKLSIHEDFLGGPAELVFGSYYHRIWQSFCHRTLNASINQALKIANENSSKHETSLQIASRAVKLIDKEAINQGLALLVHLEEHAKKISHAANLGSPEITRYEFDEIVKRYLETPIDQNYRQQLRHTERFSQLQEMTSLARFYRWEPDGQSYDFSQKTHQVSPNQAVSRNFAYLEISRLSKQLYGRQKIDRLLSTWEKCANRAKSNIQHTQNTLDQIFSSDPGESHKYYVVENILIDRLNKCIESNKQSDKYHDNDYKILQNALIRIRKFKFGGIDVSQMIKDFQTLGLDFSNPPYRTQQIDNRILEGLMDKGENRLKEIKNRAPNDLVQISSRIKVSIDAKRTFVKKLLDIDNDPENPEHRVLGPYLQLMADIKDSGLVPFLYHNHLEYYINRNVNHLFARELASHYQRHQDAYVQAKEILEHTHDMMAQKDLGEFIAHLEMIDQLPSLDDYNNIKDLVKRTKLSIKRLKVIEKRLEIYLNRPDHPVLHALNHFINVVMGQYRASSRLYPLTDDPLQ